MTINIFLLIMAIVSGGLTVYLYIENIYKSDNYRLKRKLILFSFLVLLISIFLIGLVSGHYTGYEKHKKEVNESVNK